jgi:hypothetical protein
MEEDQIVRMEVKVVQQPEPEGQVGDLRFRRQSWVPVEKLLLPASILARWEIFLRTRSRRRCVWQSG